MKYVHEFIMHLYNILMVQQKEVKVGKDLLFPLMLPFFFFLFQVKMVQITERVDSIYFANICFHKVNKEHITYNPMIIIFYE